MIYLYILAGLAAWFLLGLAVALVLGRVLARRGAECDTLHVSPIDDVIEHDTATAEPDCVCGPRVEPVKRADGSMGWILVHHALDGREVSA